MEKDLSLSNVVLVLAGLPGVGKSTVIKCFQEMGFITKSQSNDVIQPGFVNQVNEHKRTGKGKHADFPYYLSMDANPPFAMLEPHEWRQLDYALKAELRPLITDHAWEMRESDPEAPAKKTMEILDAFPAAIDSARTEGDYSHYFDAEHPVKTFLLEVVADEDVRIARVGEDAVKKGTLSTELQMIKMLDIYREKLAKQGRYICLENNFNDVEHLKQAIKSIVLPKLK
jgi:hypothetical protein